MFQNGFGLSIKIAKNTKDKSLKQLKTANINRPWAYNWEGLLSEGYLRLRFGGPIFERAYFFFRGQWGGGAYYQNFTVTFSNCFA